MMLLTNMLERQRYTGTSRALADGLAAFRASHPPKFLRVRGATWDYLAGGVGEETLMLLTGGTNSNELLFQIIAAFEPTYRVIAPRYAPIATAADLFDGLLAILDAEGVTRAHILGESFGGMVAPCLARRAPTRVASLILVSTLAPTRRWVPRMRRSGRLISLFPWSLYLYLARRQMAKALAALPIPEGERPFWTAEVLEQIGRINKGWLVNNYRVTADLCTHHDFSPADAAGWLGPVLIMRADDDAALRNLQRFAPVPLTTLYPHAQIHNFHGSGHVPPITRREEYIAALREFLASARVPRPGQPRSQRADPNQ